MPHDYIPWIALAAYIIHILEEHQLNWRDWARRVLKLPVDWESFYVVNVLVIAFGVCCAAVGWRCLVFSLSFAAVMLVNATFFHILPTVRTRVFSPGVATAVVLFYPIAVWEYRGARQDGVLSAPVAILSAVLGALSMACPVVLLKIKYLRVFRFEPGAADGPAPETAAGATTSSRP